MVVAIDQYAALSAAEPTRRPVEMRFCVWVSILLVSVRDCSAVIAATFVLRLLIELWPLLRGDYDEGFFQGHTGSQPA